MPAADLTLEITPHLAEQEMNVSYTYWEGAVQVSGNGYVELTGYASSMQDQL